MKILIAMPSKALKEASITEGLNYLSHIRRPLSATALFTSPKNIFGEEERLKRIEAEGAELLQKAKDYYKIALCVDSKAYTTQDFKSCLEKLMLKESKIAFIIGGAFGLSEEVIKNCQARLSLSSFTMPHRLAFLVLSEQLFRVSEIMRNTNYHK